jgi:hypothetical protein
VSISVAIRVQRTFATRVATGAVAVLVGLMAGCTPPEPEPRTFFDFMDDGLAREGVLTRCNQNRAATLDDVECINARRAAAVVALEQERSRSIDLERESERKLVALRERAEREAQAAARAAAAAQAAARAAYEARWRGASAAQNADAPASGTSAPVFGAPVGPVLPSMSDSSFFEQYLEESAGAATSGAPANPLEIEPPALPREELAILPRPFRADGAAN